MMVLNIFCVLLSAFMISITKGGLRVMWWISLILNVLAILVQFT